MDISGQGYNNWIFMSTHYWDEDPQGLWTLGLENKGYYFNTGERIGCGLRALELGTLTWLTLSHRGSYGFSWRNHAFLAHSRQASLSHW